MALGQGPEPRGPLEPKSDIKVQLVGKKSGKDDPDHIGSWKRKGDQAEQRGKD